MTNEINQFAAWAAIKLADEADEIKDETDDGPTQRVASAGRRSGMTAAAVRLIDLAREYNEL